MEDLIKKIKALSASVKSLLPSPKSPTKPTSTAAAPGVPKPPSPKGPKSTKDPVKVAEQLSDPDTKKQAVKVASKNREKLNISKDGQWSLK